MSADATAAAGPSRPAVIWLETERFHALGGWIRDAQFFDQVGSAYLMAHGIGDPVADAVTRIHVPRPGVYRLWARTRDWYPEFHPGRFEVVVDGCPLPHVFGESGTPGWRWETGGALELGPEAELRLHDLTGWNGRCDAICLCADLELVPPGDRDGVAAWREQYGGVSTQPQAMGRYDVVVVGGGLAGCTAAVAAGRHGLRVALIQNRPVLGGNASSEILVPPVGIWPHGRRIEHNPRETGLVEEYRTLGNQVVSEGKLYEKRLHRFVAQEPTVDLFLSTHATGVEMDDGTERRIAAVNATEVIGGQRLVFPCSVVIDCSGDSTVAVAAGADVRHGKEPASLHHEPWAPEQPVPQTMGNGLKYATRDVGEDAPFVAPEWAFSFPSCADFRPGRHPRFDVGEAIGYQWQLELGGLRDTYADAEEIRDDLLRLLVGVWDHVKNHCGRFAAAARTHRMIWLGTVAGKRENRRLVGDCVLTQNDIGNQREFPDTVAYGGWVVDDHHSAGFFHNGSFGRHQDDPEHAYRGVEFAIPFRSLYSRNVVNLMMAGRNISATHLAMSDTRVMLTCAVMGHAAGTGAAFAVRENTTPRGVGRVHIKALQQQLLKEGAHIIGVTNEDPEDLARRASVSASSAGYTDDGVALPATLVLDGAARADERSLHAWYPAADAAAPHWLELAWPQPVRFNVIHVTFQTAWHAPRQVGVHVFRNGIWQEAARVEDNHHRRLVLGLDPVSTARMRVILAESAGICEVRVYNEPAAVVAAARRALETMRQPDVGPFLPFQVDDRGVDLDGMVMLAEKAPRRGLWTVSHWSQDTIGRGYLHDGDADKGRKDVFFCPELPRRGVYEVRLAYVAHANRATNTPVSIRTVTGETTVRINQREAPNVDGHFVSLGRYELDADATVTVGTAGTDGYVVVDAVQFLPVASRGADLNLGACIRPVPRYALFTDPEYFIWGAGMVRTADGTCHLLYSRWPRETGFNAWVTHSEIAHAVAAQPLGPYRHVDVALPARGAHVWDGLCTHNPTVIEVDGRYYLYYMGNTGDRAATPGLNWRHRNNQRIGVAVADHPAGPWQRFDQPVLDVSEAPAAPDCLMVSNPAVTPRPDGGVLMVYKAVGMQRPLPFGGPVVHCVATADDPAGPFTKHDAVLFTCEGADFPAEDPFIWWQEGRYRAVLKDQGGYFTGVPGKALVLFESDNGVAWEPAEHVRVSGLEIPWADGEWQQVDRLERPQIWLDAGRPAVLFCAVREADGKDTSANVHIPLR